MRLLDSIGRGIDVEKTERDTDGLVKIVTAQFASTVLDEMTVPNAIILFLEARYQAELQQFHALGSDQCEI